MDCPSEAVVFEGFDVNDGEIIFCQKHFDEWHIRKTGMKWDDIPEG